MMPELIPGEQPDNALMALALMVDFHARTDSTYAQKLSASLAVTRIGQAIGNLVRRNLSLADDPVKISS